MATFIDMPHGYSIDIEELLYYQVSRGDDWLKQYESRENFLNVEPTENYEKEWELRQPMKLLLHFKNGSELVIPDFEKFFLDKWFFPAIKELENRKEFP